jgi:excisionase family DNA binding protein
MRASMCAGRTNDCRGGSHIAGAMSEQSSHNSQDVSKKRLYSLKDASSYLGVSYWSVRDLIHDGTLRYIRIGRRLLVDIQDLDKFVEMNKTEFIY